MRLLIVASLCGVLGCQKASEAVKSGAGSAAKQGKPRGPSVQRSNAAAVYTLPPSERVFCLDIDGDGTDEALGAQGSELWAYDLGQRAAVKLWSSTGKGVVHRIVAAEEQGQFYLYLARGIGRGAALNAPLSLSRVLASKGTVFNCGSMLAFGMNLPISALWRTRVSRYWRSRTTSTSITLGPGI